LRICDLIAHKGTPSSSGRMKLTYNHACVKQKPIANKILVATKLERTLSNN
jgi:hypothetical protein